jgi:hypothetical protein
MIRIELRMVRISPMRAESGTRVVWPVPATDDVLQQYRRSATRQFPDEMCDEIMALIEAEAASRL